jgi:hypothetical protein
MDGYLSGLVELAVTDDEELAGQINIRPIQTERFAEAHASDCQQPDQRLERGRVQRRLNGSCRRHQLGDLVLGVQIGSPSLEPNR